MPRVKHAHPQYNVALMRDDMARKGWLAQDLARHANVSNTAVLRFWSGEQRSARMALRLAIGLGFGVDRYLIPLVKARRIA